MRHFIIATDHPEKPTRSSLVVGIHEDDAKVRTAFYAARASSEHSDGSLVWELWGPGGKLDVSVARNNKPKKGSKE